MLVGPALVSAHGGTVAAAGGSQGGILWAAQWRTTGEASTDKSDGGRFSGGAFGMPSGTGVVTAASTGISGCPTTNCLYVPCDSADQYAGSAIIRHEGLGAVANGSHRYYRIYQAVMIADGSPDNQSHPIQDANAGGDINWELVVRYGNFAGADPGNYVLQYQFGTTNTNHVATGPTLPKGVWHRHEWHLHRTSLTEFTFEAWVYNAAGDLLAGPEDFVFSGGAGTLATRTLLFGTSSPNETNGLNVGSNQSNFFTGGGPQYYQAAPAVSDTGRLYTYSAATEANWDA